MPDWALILIVVAIILVFVIVFGFIHGRRNRGHRGSASSSDSGFDTYPIIDTLFEDD